MAPERRVIIDTGPLIAFFVRQEPRHAWVVEQFKALPAPLLTCEAVLAETFHLLGRTHYGRQHLFELLTRGVLAVDFAISSEVRALDKLVRKYQDLPMSLADACLVRMCEIHSAAKVLTFDRDFHIYRKFGRQLLDVLMPSQ